MFLISRRPGRGGSTTGLRAEIVRLREDITDPTGEARAEREWEAKQAKERAYDEETQQLVELAETNRR